MKGSPSNAHREDASGTYLQHMHCLHRQILALKMELVDVIFLLDCLSVSLIDDDIVSGTQRGVLTNTRFVLKMGRVCVCLMPATCMLSKFRTTCLRPVQDVGSKFVLWSLLLAVFSAFYDT